MKSKSRSVGFFLSILMITASFVVSVYGIFALSFADSLPGFQEKIKGHWSEKLLRSQIAELYFPEYAEDYFQKFEPSELVTQSSVYHALNRLYSAHGLSALEEKYDMDSPIKRKNILLLLEPFCQKYGREQTPEIAFVDCETLSSKEHDILAILADLKILFGIDKDHFAPEREMSQSEAMIVVQRIFDFPDETYAVSLPKSVRKADFTVKHRERTYNNTEGVWFEEDEKWIRITITKKFPTPAYTIHVQRVFVSEEGFHIDVSISYTDMVVTQVITYETIVIEVPKSDITKNIPFRARIENMNFDYLKE